MRRRRRGPGTGGFSSSRGNEPNSADRLRPTASWHPSWLNWRPPPCVVAASRPCWPRAAAPTPAFSWAVQGAPRPRCARDHGQPQPARVAGPQNQGAVRRVCGKTTSTARVEQRLLAAGVATPEPGTTSRFDPWNPYLAGLRQPGGLRPAEPWPETPWSRGAR